MKTYTVDIKGFKADLPVMQLPSGIGIAFFNLHGDCMLTEHCGKALAKELADCDVLLTAESKGLQLTHVIARELGQRYYAVARKSKKLYMQDGIEMQIESSQNVKIGDIVEIAFNSGLVKFEILNIKETVKKEEAENLYRIITE